MIHNNHSWKLGLINYNTFVLCNFKVSLSVFVIVYLECVLHVFAFRRTDHATPLYPQKLALTSPTSGGRSVGIVRSRTKVTELVS
jgi:hypothetical protein